MRILACLSLITRKPLLPIRYLVFACHSSLSSSLLLHSTSSSSSSHSISISAYLSVVPATLTRTSNSSESAFISFIWLNDQPRLLHFLNSLPPRTITHKRSLFSRLSLCLLFLSLCTLWSSFFPLPFLCTPTTLICNSANFMGSSLYLCVFFILTFSFCKSTLCAALFLCVPPLFSSPSLAASQFRNYSSGLKQ